MSSQLVHLDVLLALRALVRRRLVFHGEADLQHTLALELKAIFPGADVRLERPHDQSSSRQFIDIVVHYLGVTTYIELKYKTRSLDCVHGGERYLLKNQGATDHGSYDILKDIERVEAFLHSTPNARGHVIAVTNDSRYWTERKERANEPIDVQFRLKEGRILTGRLEWGESAGEGSIKGREKPIELEGLYHVRWNHFSQIPGMKNGEFRFLSICVGQMCGPALSDVPVPQGVNTTSPALPKASSTVSMTGTIPDTGKRMPNWKCVYRALQEIGGEGTLEAIRERFIGMYPDRNPINVRHELVLMSVNHPKRIHYGQAKVPRKSTDGHPIDLLFATEKGTYRFYEPNRDGEWEIVRRENGHLVVQSI